MPSSLHGQKGVECAGMAKHVEMRECWWRHLSGGRLVEGSNAHIATAPYTHTVQRLSNTLFHISILRPPLYKRSQYKLAPMQPSQRNGARVTHDRQRWMSTTRHP